MKELLTHPIEERELSVTESDLLRLFSTNRDLTYTFQVLKIIFQVNQAQELAFKQLLKQLIDQRKVAPENYSFYKYIGS